ncbi:hypothetical protein [Paenibacillus turpanensis]|uniref:hypothetical protein n=1 Tax=Paenibacillus turpanensis TaxID=2689078 RepID=UPI0014090B46|nr:hypothetical protein [Paenibacillus turpanensis]
MKTKRFTYIVLIITLLVVGFAFMNVHHAKKELQASIDQTFKSNIGRVLDSLSLKASEDSYRMILASVLSAASMAEITTFEANNDDLDIALHNLFIALRNEQSREKVLQRTQELHDLFFKLMTSPDSREATDKLLQIANETFFKAN